MSKGIKETKELIEGMGEAAVSAMKMKEVIQKILKDGINLADIQHMNELIEAMPEMSKIEAALDNAKEALEEMKDLDQAEVIELIAALYGQAKRL